MSVEVEEKELSEINERIKTYTSNFKSFRLSPEKKKVEENKSFYELCYSDYADRLESRKIYARIIVGILMAQNFLVALFIGCVAHWHFDDLPKLQIFFSILLSGTLVETYFTFNHVVKWLFNEVDYKSFIKSEIRG